MTRGTKTATLGVAVAVAIVLTSVAAASSDLPPRVKRALLQWLKVGIYRGGMGIVPTKARS